MSKNLTQSTIADQVAALIRIYKAAVSAGDDILRTATATELAKRGIKSTDLATNNSPSNAGVSS